MGFTTGFIGGATLTTFLFYLSLNLHERNRLYQAKLLRQQSVLLTNIVSPSAPPAPSTAREVRAGVADRVKDRWNAELEANVRKVYGTDWAGVREDVEERVGAVWGQLMQRSREGVEKVKDGVREGAEAAVGEKVGSADGEGADVAEKIALKRDPPRLGGLIGNRT